MIGLGIALLLQGIAIVILGRVVLRQNDLLRSLATFVGVTIAELDRRTRP